MKGRKDTLAWLLCQESMTTDRPKFFIHSGEYQQGLQCPPLQHLKAHLLHTHNIYTNTSSKMPHWCLIQDLCLFYCLWIRFEATEAFSLCFSLYIWSRFSLQNWWVGGLKRQMQEKLVLILWDRISTYYPLLFPWSFLQHHLQMLSARRQKQKYISTRLSR